MVTGPEVNPSFRNIECPFLDIDFVLLGSKGNVV